MRHSRAPDYCAHASQGSTERRPSNTCAPAGTSVRALARLTLRCMIHHLCAAYSPISHCAARRTAEVTWWQSPLSLFLSRLPSFFRPLPLFGPAHTTSLYTPSLPPPDHHFRSLRFHLSFLLSPTAPFSSEHCFKPQRIICAIHSFHLSSFFVLDFTTGYVGLPGRFRTLNLHTTTLPLTPTPAYRYAQNIPFPGSRITLC